jgi:hypothetical protein
LWERKIMNLESLAIESQQTLGTQPAVEPTPEQEFEITPLAFESFRLIGGGSSVVVV